jgi:hypothetical protein
MDIYCTYLTVYRGSKLPPFYIGSKDTKSVLDGYRGSVVSKEYGQIFKEEIANNPSLFQTTIISFHSTREEAYLKEKVLHFSLQVHINPLYINKTIAYAPIGVSNKNRKFSQAHKTAMSESQKKRYSEKGNPNLGRKNKPASEERKQKISAANKGKVTRKGFTLSEEHKKKISDAHKKRFTKTSSPPSSQLDMR